MFLGKKKKNGVGKIRRKKKGWVNGYKNAKGKTINGIWNY